MAMKDKPKGDDLPKGLPRVLRKDVQAATTMLRMQEKSGQELVEEAIRLKNHEWANDATGFIA